MTYNFDPDLWYENERTALEGRRRAGKLTDAEFDEALADLDERYEAMIERLDGTYRLPDPPSPPG